MEPVHGRWSCSPAVGHSPLTEKRVNRGHPTRHMRRRCPTGAHGEGSRVLAPPSAMDPPCCSCCDRSRCCSSETLEAAKNLFDSAATPRNASEAVAVAAATAVPAICHPPSNVATKAQILANWTAVEQTFCRNSVQATSHCSRSTRCQSPPYILAGMQEDPNHSTLRHSCCSCSRPLRLEICFERVDPNRHSQHNSCFPTRLKCPQRVAMEMLEPSVQNFAHLLRHRHTAKLEEASWARPTLLVCCWPHLCEHAGLMTRLVAVSVLQSHGRWALATAPVPHGR